MEARLLTGLVQIKCVGITFYKRWREFFLYIARCKNEQNILKVPFRELIVNSVRRSSHAQICFATLPFWTGGRSGSQASSSTGLVEIKCIGDSVLHFMNGGESFYTLQDVKMNKIF